MTNIHFVSDDELEELFEEYEIVAVNFWVRGNSTCKEFVREVLNPYIKPRLDQYRESTMVKYDISQDENTMYKDFGFEIGSSPTVAYFKDGKCIAISQEKLRGHWKVIDWYMSGNEGVLEESLHYLATDEGDYLHYRPRIKYVTDSDLDLFLEIYDTVAVVFTEKGSDEAKKFSEKVLVPHFEPKIGSFSDAILFKYDITQSPNTIYEKLPVEDSKTPVVAFYKKEKLAGLSYDTDKEQAEIIDWHLSGHDSELEEMENYSVAEEDGVLIYNLK